ncbi:MAG: NAD(P)-dependent oxidoreductase [Thermoplasmatales archaeon]
MKIWITGIAGVLGSALANMFVQKGEEVYGNDIIRPEEAWRLRDLGIFNEVKYNWKSTTDLTAQDFIGVDYIIDCGLAVPDRDFGINNPFYTVYGNILPSLHLLELLRKIGINRPKLIYPSSFNSLYGYGKMTYSDIMLSNPNSIYGWTKGSIENLVLTYHRAYNIPAIVTRVGSAYGPRMRSTELIGKLIIYALLNKKFTLYSPKSKRLWTYSEDVIKFYETLIYKTDFYEYDGTILHCAGNKNNEIVSNIALANMIKTLVNPKLQIIESNYEPGELIDGQPIEFDIEYSAFNWQPEYELSDGLKKTIYWFKNNLWRYI